MNANQKLKWKYVRFKGFYMGLYVIHKIFDDNKILDADYYINKISELEDYIYNIFDACPDCDDYFSEELYDLLGSEPNPDKAFQRLCCISTTISATNQSNTNSDTND